MKVKRSAVVEKYTDEIEELYAQTTINASTLYDVITGCD